MNLHMVSETAGYIIGSRLSVGIIKVNLSEIVLIDSGIDGDIAKKIEQLLIRHGLTPIAIINTHGHADHCGGNFYFQKKYPQIKTYAHRIEKCFIEVPYLEPLCLCQYAEPLTDLRGKFLEAKPSTVSETLPDEDQMIQIQGANIFVVHLPGHSPGMTGIVSSDGVFFIGDAFLGEESLNKHAVFLYSNIHLARESLKKIALMKEQKIFNHVIAYHGGLIENLDQLLESHHHKMDQLESLVRAFCLQPIGFDLLLELIAKDMKIDLNIQALTLASVTIRGILHSFVNLKTMKIIVEETSSYPKFVTI